MTIIKLGGSLVDKHKAANKDELLEMIRFGADTVSMSRRLEKRASTAL